MNPASPPAPTELAIANLNGFLEAFTWVNGKCNHGYTFDVSLLTKPHGLQVALENHFADTASKVWAEALTDWRAELGKSLLRWLLAYLRDPVATGRLEDRRATFSLSHDSSCKGLAEVVLTKIDKTITVGKGWRVRITQTRHFYECDWDDFALESENEFLLIHLGVSD